MRERAKWVLIRAADWHYYRIKAKLIEAATASTQLMSIDNHKDLIKLLLYRGKMQGTLGTRMTK